MANYLDLNGTTDVVGRIKAKLNEKASNDDVQVVVDELALKANKEDIHTYTEISPFEIDDDYALIINPLTSSINYTDSDYYKSINIYGKKVLNDQWVGIKEISTDADNPTPILRAKVEGYGTVEAYMYLSDSKTLTYKNKIIENPQGISSGYISWLQCNTSKISPAFQFSFEETQQQFVAGEDITFPMFFNPNTPAETLNDAKIEITYIIPEDKTFIYANPNRQFYVSLKEKNKVEQIDMKSIDFSFYSDGHEIIQKARLGSNSRSNYYINRVNGYQVLDQRSTPIQVGDENFRANISKGDITTTNGLIIDPKQDMTFMAIEGMWMEYQLTDEDKTKHWFFNVAQDNYWYEFDNYAVEFKCENGKWDYGRGWFNGLTIRYVADDSDTGFTDFSGLVNVDIDSVYFDFSGVTSFTVNQTPNDTTKVFYYKGESYDNGVYYLSTDGSLSKLATASDIDEKIGDINNALTTIIG